MNFNEKIEKKRPQIKSIAKMIKLHKLYFELLSYPLPKIYFNVPFSIFQNYKLNKLKILNTLKVHGTSACFALNKLMNKVSRGLFNVRKCYVKRNT